MKKKTRSIFEEHKLEKTSLYLKFSEKKIGSTFEVVLQTRYGVLTSEKYKKKLNLNQAGKIEIQFLVFWEVHYTNSPLFHNTLCTSMHIFCDKEECAKSLVRPHAVQAGLSIFRNPLPLKTRLELVRILA